MSTRKTTIIEQIDGSWLWAERDTTYRTLASAIKADDKRAREVAPVVTLRTIIPNTRAGRLVAKTIAG